MNVPPRKRNWLTVGAGAALLVGNMIAYLEFHAKQAAASAACENLEECKSVAADIKKLRLQPSKVTLHAHSASEVSSRLEEALKFAQLPASCLVRIDPQPARRLNGTDFKEQPTSLELRAVSIKQLVHLLYKLESSGAGLQTKSLQLTTPVKTQSDTTIETWNVQVVLTSLIFAPKKTSPS
ncbi:MAG TPA: hypothetical protein VFI31_08270 [Pirellulales bacterium]|nr:hypothetical protein [Pirellulales bacterium]